MTSLSIRMEDETKAGFDKFCDEIGLSVSSVFNMFAKKVVREQRIPFEINANPFYSEENMKFLRESIAQDKSGKTKSIPMNELESMAESSDEKIAVLKNNQMQAVMIPIDEYERLKALAEIAEQKEIFETVPARKNTPTEDYVSYEDALKQAGL